MRFQITNIGGGMNVDSATIAMQEVREQTEEAPVSPQPPFSTMQLVVPVDEAQSYGISQQYDVTIKPAK